MGNLKNIAREWILTKGNRLTDTENKLVVTTGEREGVGQARGKGLKDSNY